MRATLRSTCPGRPPQPNSALALLGLTAICLGSAALAGRAGAAPKPPMVIADRDRRVAGGRDILVELPAGGIEVEIETGRVMSDAVYGGGLIGGLMLASRDDKQQRLMAIEAAKGETYIAPLRSAIADFDFGTLAMASTRTAVTAVDWLGTRDVASIKPAERPVLTDPVHSAAAETARITYRYTISPDFTQVRVIADIALWRSVAVRGASGKPQIFAQRIITATMLHRKSYDPAVNVGLWSENGGKRTRAAIAQGLKRMEALIPLALALDQQTAAWLTAPGSPKQFAGGFYGPPVPAFPVPAGETLLWSNAIVDIMPLPPED